MVESRMHRPTARFAFKFLAPALLCFLLAACASLDPNFPRSPSYTIEPPTDGRLSRYTDALLEGQHGYVSAFYILNRNDEALLWRLALADLAETSLDIQYFIWQGDQSALLLMDRLIRAADRGVRVRLLVDDITVGMDDVPAALSHHPNFEVRVFNPWEGRSGGLSKGLEWLSKMKRLNHRMHNKLMVADNRMAIVGGRNIGNEYFGLAKKYNFSDLDLLGVGPIAKDVSHAFDIFWNSVYAYPGKGMAPEIDHEKGLQEIREYLSEVFADPKTQEMLTAFPLTPVDWQTDLDMLRENHHVGDGTIVYDQPLIGKDLPPVQIMESLSIFAAKAQNELLISSPYFIPGDNFVRNLGAFTKEGISVKILTNSLGSTNHPIVVSAARDYRRPVIAAGGELYEMRHDAAVAAEYNTPPIQSKAFGLHSKVFTMDRVQAFVGSLNLDPRSIYINTEMGMLVTSESLTSAISDLILRDMQPENAWRLSVNEKDEVLWTSSAGTVDRDPARNWWQRFQVWFFGLFPLEDQL
jgi:putative cardiolipin synthase